MSNHLADLMRELAEKIEAGDSQQVDISMNHEPSGTAYVITVLVEKQTGRRSK